MARFHNDEQYYILHTQIMLPCVYPTVPCVVLIIVWMQRMCCFVNSLFILKCPKSTHNSNIVKYTYL